MYKTHQADHVDDLLIFDKKTTIIQRDNPMIVAISYTQQMVHPKQRAKGYKTGQVLEFLSIKNPDTTPLLLHTRFTTLDIFDFPDFIPRDTPATGINLDFEKSRDIHLSVFSMLKEAKNPQ